MIYAFLRVETLDDLRDCVALMRRGATIGVEPIAGSLFGPTAPVRWAGGSKPLRYAPIELADFVLDYMARREPFRALVVEDCPDVDLIEEAWRILNHAAASWLSRPQIVALLELLARRYGGRIEAQVAYGSDGWAEHVRAGHLITCWCRPSVHELGDIARYGARGVIDAEGAASRRPWFAGVSGPYLLPNRGFIEHHSEDTPQAAWERSGEPTGVSASWDSVRGFYRLCGLVVDDADPEVRKAPMWEAMQYAVKRGLRPQDDAVRPVGEIPRSGEAVNQAWGSFVRIDFES